MIISSALETSPAINSRALQSYIVAVWGAAAKNEYWDRAITILTALEVVTDGELADEISLLIWLAFMRQEMAAQQAKEVH